jgi:pyruvate kinase
MGGTRNAYVNGAPTGVAQLPKTDQVVIACTLGPRSLNERVIEQLQEAGTSLFRVNMSHTEVGNLDRILRFVRKQTKVPLSIDTEGARLRTGQMTDRVSVSEGAKVRLVPEAFWGDAFTIPITPGDSVAQFVPGALVSIDFDAVILRVDAVDGESAHATVLTGGEIGTRKAVTALPSPRLPTFSSKDEVATRIAIENGVREFALSFCETASSIRELRAIVGGDAKIVAKIESREGVLHLDEILEATDRILIDRGDLSREVRMEGIPMLQKEIIRKANARDVPVYVATNLLESMVTRRVPTRAEVNDVLNTLLDGADGLVLSAETAVGTYPVEAARMIASLVEEFQRERAGIDLLGLLGEHPLAHPPGHAKASTRSSVGESALGGVPPSRASSR